VNIAESVAEFVIAQTLSILREPHRHDAGMKAGEGWLDLRQRYLGRLLGAQTVGLVGAGYVGRLVIGLFRAFGCRLLVSDPYLTAEKAAELGVERASLDEVLSGSDIVSLHAPALPETRHMIGAAQLAQLRDGCLFINTARPALVDEAALLAALRTGRFTAALDVFDQEPLPADSPFRSLPNVVLSPHAAGHSEDSHKRQGTTTVDEIRRFLAGEPLRHRVTPAMLATMA
jgi:phosphoglycerate dehydrogenase-like enzyme